MRDVSKIDALREAQKIERSTSTEINLIGKLNALNDKSSPGFMSVIGWTSSQEPVDFNQPEQIIQRAMEYFQLCNQNGCRPLLSGLAQCMGTSRLGFGDLMRANSIPKAAKDALRQVKQMLEQIWENDILTTKTNSTGLIFYGLNNFQYTNNHDSPSTGGGGINDDVSLQELAELAASLPPPIIEQNDDEENP